MLEFLSQNSGVITRIFTGVVTLFTVLYATPTAVLVAETRRMRQAQTEPKIEVVISQGVLGRADSGAQKALGCRAWPVGFTSNQRR